AAQAIHRRAGYFDRKAGKEKGHACDVPIVFARLVGAAENDLVQCSPIDARITLHKGFERYGAQIIGSYRGERAAEAPDRSTDIIADKCLSHGLLSLFNRSLPPAGWRFWCCI